jgi:putative addiction module component (TIGR02574 family)
MTQATKAIFDAALALPEPERSELADLLLESLPPDPETEEFTEEELLAELERRRAEVEQGGVKPIPLSDFRFEE